MASFSMLSGPTGSSRCYCSSPGSLFEQHPFALTWLWVKFAAQICNFQYLILSSVCLGVDVDDDVDDDGGDDVDDDDDIAVDD